MDGDRTGLVAVVVGLVALVAAACSSGSAASVGAAPTTSATRQVTTTTTAPPAAGTDVDVACGYVRDAFQRLQALTGDIQVPSSPDKAGSVLSNDIDRARAALVDVRADLDQARANAKVRVVTDPLDEAVSSLSNALDALGRADIAGAGHAFANATSDISNAKQQASDAQLKSCTPSGS